MKRCEMESKSRYSFMRTWWCSLEKGHEGAHVAYPRNEKPENMADVCWLGPWADGSPFPTLEEFAAEHGPKVVGGFGS